MSELKTYVIRDANATISDNPFDNNVFYPADGVNPSDGMDTEDEFSYLGGMRARRKARQARRNTRVQSKAKARENRSGAKLEASIAQGKASEALANEGNSGGGSRMNMENINTGNAKPKKKGGLSTGAKIGIGVGVALLLGIVTFVVIKKMKK